MTEFYRLGIVEETLNLHVVVHRLGHHHISACVELHFQSLDFSSVVYGGGLRAGGTYEVGVMGHRLATGIDAVIESVTHVQKRCHSRRRCRGMWERPYLGGHR